MQVLRLVVLVAAAVQNLGILHSTAAFIAPNWQHQTLNRISSVSSLKEAEQKSISNAVVIGYIGGTAEWIACKLGERQDIQTRAIFGASNNQTQAWNLPSTVKPIFCDIDRLSQIDFTGVSLAFISLDRETSTERGSSTKAYKSLPAILSSLAASDVPSILVSAYANDTIKSDAEFSLFSGKGVNPRVAIEQAKLAHPRQKVVLVQHGRLCGPMPGQELLPFISGPLQRPVIEESFLKQGVLLGLGPSVVRSGDAATSREVLAETIVRAATASHQAIITDFSVLSLEGPAPSAADWDRQLAQLDARRGVVVYEKEFGSKESMDLYALQKWLVEDFGTALSTLAASRVLHLPKPSLVRRSQQGCDIIWQCIDRKMQVQTWGKWCVRLEEEPKAIR